MRKLIPVIVLFFSSLTLKGQCPIVNVSAANFCPGGPAQNVIIDISEDAVACFDNGQNPYTNTIILDFSGAGFQFVPGTEILNTGAGDINDGGAAFISTISPSQIIIDGLGTNNGGGGANALDQITLSVDVVSTATGSAFIQRNGGTFLIGGAVNPVPGVPLVTLTSDQMVYNSTGVTQNGANVSQNTTNAQILQIPIDVTGNGCPLSIESFDLQYSGTALADISAIKIYYSGTNPAFNPSTDVLFGGTTSPLAATTINGSQDLVDGTNYFWVAVDVPFTATAANQIDLDLIQYQYDDNGTPTIRSNGVDFLGGPAGSRTITAFSGTVLTVGTLARNHTTLQAAYDAVPNNLANNYIIELYNDYNDALETFPINFAQKTAYNGNIILIRPAAGQTGIRVGGNPGANQPLINFNSADYVTIDGRANSTGAGHDMRFVNLNSTASAFSVFSFTNGSTYNKLDYLDIEGEAETSLTGLIDFEFAGGGTGNSNNTISNNLLTDVVGGTAKTPGVAIYSLGNAGTPNENNTIENNEFVNIFDGGNFDSWCIQLSTGTDNWSIYGNHFYQTVNYAACDFNSGFIQVEAGGSYDIIGNYFGGQAVNAGGSKFAIATGLAPFDCIYFLPTASGGENRFLSNTIGNIVYNSQTTLAFPALTFLYNESATDIVVGSADGPNTFGSQSLGNDVGLVNNAASGSTGISGITNNGGGLMTVTNNNFGGITVGGTRSGATTILVDNLDGDMIVENCTFGGTNANSIDIDSDSRFEIISNSALSGIDVNDCIFRNISHKGVSEPVYGIYNLDGILNADGNTFANISTLGAVEHRMIDHLGSSASITDNTFENIAVTSNTNTSALAMIYTNSTSALTISDNTLGSVIGGNIYVAGNDFSYGIYKSGSGSLTCERNTIQGLEMDNAGASVRYYGIYNIGGNLNASENIVINNSIQSTNTLTALYGIYCSASGNNHIISDNLVEDNAVDNGTTAISTSIEGIYISGNSTTCERNTIRGLYNSGSSQSSEIIGINNAFGPDVIKNNVVILDNASTPNSVSIKGIVDNDGTGTVRVVHNTVVIGGNSVGTSSSTAYYRNADGNDMVSNNIFQNNRAGASGPDYCIEVSSTAGTFNSDYNFCENIDNSQMFSWGGAGEDLPTFQGSSGSNLNSQVGAEAIDNDGRTTAGFAMADGGTDLFTPTIVVVDKDLNARDVNPWPGAYEGAAVVVCNDLEVTNTLDDGTCGSLRGAINFANTNPGADTITFNTAVMGSNIIQIFSTLPALTDDYTFIEGDVDGDCKPDVTIDGIGGAYHGIEIQSDSNTIHGLNVDNCSGNSNAGIYINGGDYNFITCNTLGTDLQGNATGFGNDFGVFIGNAGFGNIIGDTVDGTQRNIISGNLEEAVLIQGAFSNYVSGNYIGADYNGTTFLGNQGDGIMIITSADNNVIGGTNPGTGNLVIASTLNGIYISGSVNNTIIGNKIGLELSGAVAGFGNGDNGIEIDNADNNFIGDGTADGRNFISGNSGHGIRLFNSDFCEILNNYIGTDITGMLDIGNSDHGISIDNSDDNLVGNNTGTTGNLISGNNKCGIQINQADNNEIYGNLIGTDATGLSALMNSWRGIRGSNTCTDNIIGAVGVTPNVVSGNFHSGIEANGGFNSTSIVNNYIGVGIDGVSPVPNNRSGIRFEPGTDYVILGNTIAYNLDDGIDFTVVATSNNNVFNINSIYSNGLRGIDFGGFAVQGSVVPPVINSVQVVAGDTIVSGTASSGANVYVYNDSTTQGQVYLNTTVALGDGSWSMNVNGYGGILANGLDSLTALQDVAGNSSEFSLPIYKVPSCNPLVVTSTLDDGSCGTLRGAITYANATAGADTVLFNISVGAANAVQTITVSGANLPSLTDQVFIDGGSQNMFRGVSSNLFLVEIEGPALPAASARGLDFQPGSDDSRVYHLVLNQFEENEIRIANTTGVRIDSNYLGVDPTGLLDFSTANQNIRLNNADNCSIVNNIISGAEFDGLFLSVGSDLNYIQGNIIGLGSDGSTQLGANDDNITIDASHDNVIGGTGLGEGNIISDAADMGIEVRAASTGNKFLGNTIGLDVTGSFDRGNGSEGISIFGNSNGNEIGDGTAAGRNIISGNNNHGIDINGSDNNIVIGNYIGTNISGLAALPNSGVGIYLSTGADFNDIGDGTVGGRNIISSNSTYAMRIASSNSNKILGNYIGTDVTGNVVLAGSANGIRMESSSSNNQIGSTTAPNIIGGFGVYALWTPAAANNNTVTGNSFGVGADGVTPIPNDVAIGITGCTGWLIDSNIIANNTGNGISFIGAASDDNLVHYNSIYSNTLKAIDIIDANGQDQIIPPVITSVSIVGLDTLVSGTSSPNALIQIYNDAAEQGQVFLDTAYADATGNWSKIINGYGAYLANGLDSLTALQDSVGNTSEFSLPIYKVPTSCDTSTVAGTWTWNGSTSTDWFDCSNWTAPAAATGTLPGSNADVVIPGGTPVNPVITIIPAYCRTLQINVPGGGHLTLDTSSGASLHITQ